MTLTQASTEFESPSCLQSHFYTEWKGVWELHQQVVTLSSLPRCWYGNMGIRRSYHSNHNCHSWVFQYSPQRLQEAHTPLPAIGSRSTRSTKVIYQTGFKEWKNSRETTEHIMNLPYLVYVYLMQLEHICKSNSGAPQNPSFWQRQSGRHALSVSEPAPQACYVDTVTNVSRWCEHHQGTGYA